MIFFIVWNVLVFFLYGIDKHSAMKGYKRINEDLLFWSAFFMGGMGAFLGMQFFRHKTRHIYFRIFVPIAVLLNFVVIYTLKKVL